MLVHRDDPERARRLAEALRQNLRRRKAQTRDRDAAAASDEAKSPSGRADPADA